VVGPTTESARALIRQLEKAALPFYIGVVGSDLFGQLFVFDRAPNLSAQLPSKLGCRLCGIADCAARRQLLQQPLHGSRRVAYGSI